MTGPGDPRRASIEAEADRVIAADVDAGRPGKVPVGGIPVPGTGDGPRLGCVLWILAVVVTLIVGLFIGTSIGDDDGPSSTTPVETPGGRAIPGRPTTTTAAPPTTTTAVARASSLSGGWDHPPYATAYTNAATGQPVAGLSVVLACARITGAPANGFVEVTWNGPSGAVTGTGRLDASGAAIVAGGINSVGAYTVQSIRVAPPSNASAMVNAAFTPPSAPTNVTLPADQLCTP